MRRLEHAKGLLERSAASRKARPALARQNSPAAPSNRSEKSFRDLKTGPSRPGLYFTNPHPHAPGHSRCPCWSFMLILVHVPNILSLYYARLTSLVYKLSFVEWTCKLRLGALALLRALFGLKRLVHCRRHEVKARFLCFQNVARHVLF